MEQHLLALAEGSEKPDTTGISSVPDSTIGTFVAGSSIVVGLTQFITGLFQ